MKERYDLNLLLKFCRVNEIGFTADFSEASDELQLEVFSAAPSERLFMKRVPSIEYFIEKWNEQMNRGKEHGGVGT